MKKKPADPSINSHRPDVLSGGQDLHRNPPPLLRNALIITAYLFAFIILDFMTKQFQGLPGIVAWYPPVGLTYALLLVFGVGFAPAVTIALFISSVFIYRMPQPPYLLFLWALIISLIYSLAAAFLRKRIRFDWQLRKLRDVTWLVFTAVVVSALLAILSVVSSALSSDMPRSEILYGIFEWWIGETVGVLTITPFLLIFVMPVLKRFAEGQPVKSPARRSFPHPMPSAIGQTASLAFILYLVFGAPLLNEFYPLYLITLPIIWIALDHGLKGVSAGLVALNFGVVLALWFFRFDPAQIGELELLMIVTCIAGLLMGAVVTERKDAEEMLVKSRNDYQRLFEGANDVIVIFEPHDEIILAANAAACSMYGLDQDELVGMSLKDLTRHAAQGESHVQDLLKDGPQNNFESIHFNRNGQDIHFLINYALIEYQGKKAVLSINRDITERKQSEEGIIAAEKLAQELLAASSQSRQALLSMVEDQKQTEEKLAASETELRSLFAAMTDVVIVYDADGRYLKIAPTKLTSFYRPLDDMLGKTVYDILPKEQADYIVAKIGEAIQTGQVVTGEYALQVAGREMWFASNATRLSENTAVWVAHDITERKQAVEALYESEQKFRSFVEQSEDAAVLTDERGAIIEWNLGAERIFGRQRARVIEQFLWDVQFEALPKEWKTLQAFEQLKINLLEALKTGKGSWLNQLQETELQRSDGVCLTIQTMAFPIQTKSGFMLGSISRDITTRKRAEEALHESEERFRVIFENANDAIHIENADDEILAVNSRMCELVGYSREELLTMHVTDLQAPEKRRPGNLLNNEFARHGSAIFEGLNLHHDGRRIPVEISIGHIELHSEYLYVSVVRDITERKQAEEALRESEERLRLSLRAANQGMYDLNVQTGDAIVNEAYVLMLGYDPETFVETNAAWIERLHPDDKDTTAKAYTDYINGVTSEYRVEFRQQTRDGDWKWILSMGKVIEFDADGKPLRMLGTHTDITGRKKAEEALQLSEEKYRTLVDEVNDGFYMTDSAGVFTFANPALARMYGFESPQALVGRKFTDLIATELHTEIGASYSSAMQTGHTPEIINGQIMRPDGIRAFIEIKPTFIIEGGQIAGSRGVIRDITERKRAEESLRESEERFRSLYENATIGIYRTTPAGDILLSNPALVKMIGYDSFEEWATHNLEKEAHYAPDYPREQFKKKIEKDGEVRGIESAWKRKDGSTVYVRESAKVVRDPHGEILYYEGSVEDITERKIAENALRALSTRQEAILDAIPDILMEVNKDKVYTWANPTGIEFFGEDVIGKEAAFYFVGDQDTYKLLEPLFNGSKETIYVENWQRCKDGEKRLLAWQCQVLKDKDGNVTGALSSAHDITERKRMEDALYLMSDTQGQIVHLDNLTDIYQLVGKKIQELIGDGYVSISMLDEKIQAMKVVGLYGFGDLYKKLVHRFKVDPSKFVFPLKEMTDDEVRLFQSGKLEKIEGGLYAMLTRKVPKSICDLAEKQLKITGIYAMGFTGPDIHYGGLTLLAKRDITPYKDMIETIMNQTAISIKRIRAEDKIRQRASELEMLYQSGLALNQLLSPKEIGQKIIELLEQKMDWHHTTIRAFNPQNEILELLAFNQPGLKGAEERLAAEERFKMLITRPSDGLSGWAVLNSQIVRSGDVSSDPYYVETYPGLRSGLYVPIKSDERMIGVISIESDKSNAFSEADERLVATLSNQAAVAFENSHLYQTAQEEIIRRKQIENILADDRNQLALRVQERTADLSQANLDLAYALRVKSEFLASMSHELRTPLTGILGLSEALQLKTYGELNDRQQKILKTIEESGRHLQDLINDILDLSRIEAGKLDLQFVPCSLADICQASLQLTKGMAHQKGQIVQYSPTTEPVIVRADARRLKQILVNLLGNAIKFTPQNGELGLDVQVSESEQKVRLTVWDKGIGIKPEELRRLFNPFVQLDSSLARQYAGTGLGLYLVERLTEAHNGGIEVESTIGEGSRFTVILPWSPQNTTPIPYGPQREPGRPSSSLVSLDVSISPLILLVDDNEVSLQMVADFLEAKQYRVIKTRSGAELLERAAEFHPDIMLVDIQMSGMDGMETIRRIRSHADPLIAAAPVIAVTALAMPGDRENCLRAGADDYMSKPMKLKELAAVIQKLLERKP